MSAAKDMDLSNSWHRYDDWNNDDDGDDSETDHLDQNGYSADGSVVVVNIPTIEAPILHICRAKLPNGKLCPRKDRTTCPFHGKIVERDNEGNEVSGRKLVEEMFDDDRKRTKKRKMKTKRVDIRDKIMKQIKRDPYFKNK